MSASAECIDNNNATLSSTKVATTILVVEDDLALQEAIVDTLELSGLNAIAADSGEQALICLEKQRFDMIISDVNMGGMDGHQLLDEIKKHYPFLPVLLITAYASIDRSVRAIQAGAVDYLVKPFDPSTLIELVRRYTIGQSLGGEGPVIASQISRDLFQMAERVAMTDSTVLISGESGTGKEVIARFIHAHSSRKAAPFIAINCAAIPETMLEATLFGHEKGAFTGAHQSAPGKFEQANGGTLLLDEVSEMDLSLQAKLLRVLQEREVERVGGRKVIALDVRIIATTNRDLKHCVAEGDFREDLFYRLSVFPIRWPALRERLDDVIPLAEYLLLQHANKMGRGKLSFSTEAQQCLLAYAWPGNVRELDNIVQRALILQAGDTIYPNDLLFDQTQGHTENNQSTLMGSIQNNDKKILIEEGLVGDTSINYSADLKQREYEIIIDALNESRGSKKQAAEKLGISPRTLRYKMAKMREQGLTID
ncbi:sigma-54 dependent transcriptional regulator [Pseudomonadales bacterium]|nr:sigma-54 dependent transcriptional regulator [Pseudomonadales bacterium]